MTEKKSPKKPREICPHCGQRMPVAHKHNFHRGLAAMLAKMADKFVDGQPFNPGKDLELKNKEYSNYPHLQYWGLIRKSRNPDGTRRKGYWELTRFALHVINGGALSQTVEVCGKVLGVSQQMTTMTTAVGGYVPPDVWAERARALTEKEREQQRELPFDELEK